MLVFVWNWNATDGGRAAERTERCIAGVWPGCKFVRLEDESASSMNRELAGYGERFFFVADAGDTFGPGFFPDVRRALNQLKESDAGLIVDPADGGEDRDAERAGLPPRAPSFWRTAAVMSGSSPGFAEREALPFGKIALLDKKRSLDREWTWGTLRSSDYRPAPRRKPGWLRSDAEWRYLAPLLAAECTAPPANAPPLFTIAVCTYNDAEYLPWALRSVRVQTLPEWELIVVDDGSDDRTEDVLRQSSLLGDIRIQVHRNDTNRGKAASLNRALAAARGRWLLELDADDWLAPDCLVTMARYAAHAQGLIAAIGGEHVEWLERANHDLIPGNVRSIPVEPSAAELLEHPFAIAPRAYSVPLLRRIGGWWTHDPYGGRLYEDLQMLIRVAPHGSLLRIPVPLYHRRVRTGSVTQRGKACYPKWREWMEVQTGNGLTDQNANEFEVGDRNAEQA
ncbi:glycosyltransferase family 2 protein [Cohnella zeiphila]|uniref:Glycosyltransferase family 2 protein n=1 Tax=Cohnella zeiphila TaxID=2761120 RepID=A0A7X0VXK0_9BACL|nr:glycosyltransferase family A protein [Cohnella zeiphila]MBB6734364.1 glycosyltransferase family 2 protein [Cohnella zeiphila]